MAHNSYHKKEYQELQSKIMKENWRKGLFDFVRKRENRKCKREGCNNIFEVTPSDPKVYCSKHCSVAANNIGRLHSTKTKLKIAKALIGTVSPYKGIIKVPRVELICANPKCKKLFTAVEWGKRKRKYCSNQCTMAVVGGKPTSPKASRGKAGIRKDVSNKIYFYSRW